MDTAVSGELMSVFGISVLDAVLISWIVLRWYAHSVARLMRQTGAPSPHLQAAEMMQPGASPTGSSVAAVSQAPSFSLFNFGPRSRAGRAVSVVDSRRRRRLMLAYLVGGVLHSSVMTALLGPWDDSASSLAEWLAEFWTNLWPVVPTLIVLFALDRMRGLRLAAVFVSAGLIVVLTHLLVQVSRGSVNAAPIKDLYLLPLGLILAAGPPAILVLLTSWRRVRGVSPLTLAATLVFGFALILVKTFAVAPRCRAGTATHEHHRRALL